MKFLVERDKLIAALAPAYRHAKIKQTIPILNHVLLTAEASTLRIAGNDLMACAEASCAAEVELPGAVAVHGDQLQKLAQRMPEGCQVTGELVDAELSIRFGRSRYKLPTLPAQDFPALMVAKDAVTFELTADQVDALLKRTKPFTTDDPSRPYLGGVHLREQKGSLVGEASDGHMLMQRAAKVKCKGLQPVIVPVGACEAIVEMSKDGSVRLSCSQNLIGIEAGNIRVTSKLIDGTFPDLQRVIPDADGGSINCDREELIEVVERLMVIDDDKRAVTIGWEKGGDSITVSLRGAAEGAEQVAAEIDNLEAGQIGVTPRELRTLLQETPGEIVTMRVIDAGTPLRIAHKLTSDMIAVVMPRRI